MKIRVAAPLPGVYQDFRAVVGENVEAARAAGAKIVFAKDDPPQVRNGVLVMKEPPGLTSPGAPPALELKTPNERKQLKAEFKQYPEEVFALAGSALGTNEELRFRTSSTHLLARELTAPWIAAAVADGRAYRSADWLCDSAGFFFVAENLWGVYDIGDRVPLISGTRLRVNLPIAAKITIAYGGETVAETTARQFIYAIKGTGDYRLRVSLTIDGETWPWIDANPIHVEEPQNPARLAGPLSLAADARKNISYLDDSLDQHKLDLYLPRGNKNFPVMIFLPGVDWHSGDRSAYALFGNRFALAGIGVAIPSYRPMPKHPYPAQPEDAAAAFAWVRRHIADYGGDVSRIYLAGYSAGAHMAALVALDPKYLAKYQLNARAIRGVALISGIYQVGALADFQNADDDPSPIDHVHSHVQPGAPPFLLTYCQWDYFGLPKQARDFAAALQAKFVDSRLIYIAGKNHISEIEDALNHDDPTARAILDFIQ